MIKRPTLERWTPRDAADLYGIRNWGAGYFDVSPEGDVLITPFKDKKKIVNLSRVIEGIRERGLDLPVLLRVEDILHSQISWLHRAFAKAIKELDYSGGFQGVFPIKVNQQHQVLAELTRFGSRYHHGLEAGSKAELIAALAMLEDPEACLVCNGYKDTEFIDLGLLARKMGMKVFFVLEMPSELDIILERSAALGIEPLLGVRMKLSSTAGGHWTESGGDRSIFGLSANQLVEVVDKLREAGKLDTLALLHYHLGSQIPNIRDIRQAATEAARVYSGLVAEGATMGYLDLGGGLAVDYDGSKTNFESSRNYSVDEYCTDVVEAVMGVLDEAQVAHPVLITESGRATVAYYSVLLFEVLDAMRFDPDTPPPPLDALQPAKAGVEGCSTDDRTCPDAIVNMAETLENLSVKTLQECYNDALYYRDEARRGFNLGTVTLRERAVAEHYFWTIVSRASELTRELRHPSADLAGLRDALADIYYCNFSVFQSLPDAWAIEQLFPIMPIHRLTEQPTRHAILADITCDCDGKIDRFVDVRGVKRSLPVHELRDDESYVMGAFLVGAYQETLGDLHNLLGDTHVVSIRVLENEDEEWGFEITSEVEGDSVADVLSYVEYEPRQLVETFRHKAERAVRSGSITPAERKRILRTFREGLDGYTYFEK